MSCLPDIVHGSSSITKKNFHYLGAFRVPKGKHGQSSFANNTGISFQPLTYNPENNSLFLAQKPDKPSAPKGIGEISIPKIINPAEVDFDINKLETATVLQDIADISEGTFDKIKAGGLIPPKEARAKLGGLFVYNKKLYGTVWGYYDASRKNSYRSHWTANVDWSEGYGFSGLHAVGEPPEDVMSSTGGIVGGYIAEIPDKYKEDFGFSLVAGRVGGPIISRSSYGPTLWGFDPDSYNGDEPANAEMWIGYTKEHKELGTYSDSPSLYFTRGTTVQSVIWPDKGDTVLFFGVHGFGARYDETGHPVANEDGICTGPGTSSREEAKANSWLISNYPDGYRCGYTVMSSTMIANGESCCFDPEDPSRKEHELPYSVGYGQSCYGQGSHNWTYARRNDWLRENSSSGYDCDGHHMSAKDIKAGNGCCYRGAGNTYKGESAYPTVYQVWSYQVSDILDVKQGKRQPYELQPTIWNYDLPFDPDPSFAPKSIIGAAFDSVNQRLFIGQAFGDGEYPLIHVFKLVMEEDGAEAPGDPDDENSDSEGSEDSDDSENANSGPGTNDGHGSSSITKKNFHYLGAFRVPKGQHGQSSFANNTGISFQPLTYNPENNSLFLAQKPDKPSAPKGIGEISIPKIINPAEVDFDINKLETATVLQDIADISEGAFDKIKAGGLIPSEDSSKAKLGGLFVYNKKLYGTVWGYYDASTENSYRSHWTANVDWSEGYNFSGLHAVGELPKKIMCSTGGIVGGYIAEIPDKYKEDFGFPLVAGRVGGPIISRSSYGPTLWGFDPDSYNGDEPANAEMWIGYTKKHKELGTYSDSPSLYFTRGTTVQSVIWPDKGGTVLFFGVHGFGPRYDDTGHPVANEDGICTGPGTSSREEARANSWLISNSPDGYRCGYTVMSSTMITGGESCCFDPEDPSRKEHELPYSVGEGQSCYGPGTHDWTYARRNDWLRENSSSGYDCGGHYMSAKDIKAGNGCCYRGAGNTYKGGSAYPTVYQVWSYQVSDILDVKQGKRQPYELRPTIWNYDLPFDPDPSFKPKSIIGAAFDSVNQRVFIGQAFGDGEYPLIHVFRLVMEEDGAEGPGGSDDENSGSGGSGGSDGSDDENSGSGGSGGSDGSDDENSGSGGSGGSDGSDDENSGSGGSGGSDGSDDENSGSGGSGDSDGSESNDSGSGRDDITDLENMRLSELFEAIRLLLLKGKADEQQ